jgi:hypothetical protein
VNNNVVRSETGEASVSKYSKLYRNACIWSVSITLVSYGADMALMFAGYNGPAERDGIWIIPSMVLLPGMQATGWLSRVIPEAVIGVIPGVDWAFYFVLWPLCACITNAVIALLIAFLIARLRDLRRTQPVDQANGLSDERQG